MRWEVCHGERAAVTLLAPGPGRRGGRPGPPGLPRKARVGLTTGSAARMDRREVPLPAGPSGTSGSWGAGSVVAAPTGSRCSSQSGTGGLASGSGSSMPSYQEMGDSPGSGAGDANHSLVLSSWASPASALAAVRSGSGGLPSNRWPASAGTSPPEAPPRATRSYHPRRRRLGIRRPTVAAPGRAAGRRSGPAARTRMAPRGPARPGQRCPHAAIHRPIRALDDDSHSSNHFPCSS